MRTLKATLAASLLAVSSAVLAIPYTTVGGADQFLGQTKAVNSGDATAEAWAESVVGSSLTFIDKDDGFSDWLAVDNDPVGTNLYAMSVGTDVDYFLVKTGKIGEVDTFLFRNISELAYLVVDLKHFGDTFDIKVGKISHTNLYSDGVTTDQHSVPEPSSLGLLAAGILGLVAARRFARKV